MLYNQDLIDIINKQNFKQFFVLLDYLLIAGFKEIDAFGIALKHFPENKIWENVAFIRQYEKSENLQPTVYDQYLRPITIHEDMNGNRIKEKTLIVGILDENNIHLSGLFDVYRNRVCKDMFPFLNDMRDGAISIEKNCKTILKFSKPFSLFIMDYLELTFKKHFGYDMIPKDNKPTTPTANNTISRFLPRNNN